MKSAKNSEFQIQASESENPKIKSDGDSGISSADMRVLLWDIDGTLLSSTASGAFKEYFAPVMLEIFGSSGRLADLQVSGMTDTQIFYESLKDEGFTPEQILAQKEKLLPAFEKAMTEVVAQTKTPFELKTGAREILEATSKNRRFLNALLTGNLSVAARVKLEYLDLWKYFADKPNIYGEVSHDRRDLGKSAVETVGKFLGLRLKAERFVVIGDTPNDIAAARAFGAKMVSVATGKNHPFAELAKYKPDALLADLSDTGEVLRVFETV